MNHIYDMIHVGYAIYIYIYIYIYMCVLCIYVFPIQVVVVSIMSFYLSKLYILFLKIKK